MAHNKSALKRQKQDAKKRVRNKARKSAVATYERSFMKKLTAGEVKDAQDALVKCISAYDKAAKKGVISQSKADRKKSRLTIALNKAQA
jgi:small subunit ribosomal protein S20